VLERRMPPWGAVKGVGEFRDDPSLSRPEIDMIVNWVEGGAPKGEDMYLPPAPEVRDFEKEAPRKLSGIEVESGGAVILEAPVTVVAIAPRDLAAGASMEVIAYLPDESVQHLIWLKDYREEWKRTYYFREPMMLPEATRIVVEGNAAGRMRILSERGKAGAKGEGKRQRAKSKRQKGG